MMVRETNPQSKKMEQVQLGAKIGCKCLDWVQLHAVIGCNCIKMVKWRQRCSLEDEPLFD